MKAVTKYKLQEGLLIITFFFIVFLLNILFSDVEDLPVLRGLVGVVFLGSVTAWYEIVVAVKLQRKLYTITYILFNLVFYYTLFSVMLLGHAYIELIFKQDYTLAQAFSKKVTELYPGNFHFMIFYLFIFLFLLQFIRQIRVTAIKGVTREYFKGRIRQSITGTRIFLFMDLYSSTAYAEKLGHRMYSSFIKDIYNELDEYILATKGSLYQFVGDEVVIVWNMKDGIQNDNALRFFFLVEEALNKKEKYFMDTYGIVPEFKAGIHCGEVSITEIGSVLKREIAYHGDTVNTTARICGKCKELGRRVLVSGKLVKYFGEERGDDFEKLGNYKLKGKEVQIALYSMISEKINADEAVSRSFDPVLCGG